MTELNLNSNAKEVKVKRTRKAKAVELQADVPAVRATSVQVGDKGTKAIQATIASMPLDNVKNSTLAIESNPINDRNKSGKKFGGMVVNELAQLIVATGETTKAKWLNQYTKTATTPAGGTTTTTQSIGDGRRKAVATPICALNLPKVLKADLVKGSHPINNSNLSGKKLGAMVADETGLIYVALGSNWNSVWFSSTPITPAGAPTSNVSGITGQKAKSVNAQVATVNITVVKAADVADIDHPINIAKLSGKQLGAMVIIETGDILVAKGSDPDSPWVKQIAASEVTPA